MNTLEGIDYHVFDEQNMLPVKKHVLTGKGIMQGDRQILAIVRYPAHFIVGFGRRCGSQYTVCLA